MPRARLVIGCMTGTSLDGVDAAALRIEGEGLDIAAAFVTGASGGLHEAGALLLPLARGEKLSAEEITRARRAYGEAIADTVAEVAGLTGAHPHLVAIHGQTVFHRPPWSWQLVDPWPVARRLACPVVFDLRGADLAAGGQGAPITPLADWVLFRSDSIGRAIVNLGGFCNATLLPAGASPSDVRGFDICACNQVLDEAARLGLRRPFDQDGAGALSGTPRDPAVEALALTLRRQAAEGRSLGTGDEGARWCADWEDRLIGVDLVASAADAVGRVIGEALRERLGPEGKASLAGGGVRNAALVRAIERALDRPTGRTDDLGVPAQFREAAGMAVLGALAADGICVTLPGVTGAGQPIPLSGAWVNARINPTP